ncbi:MAG TPA: class I SAM-dependent methyltransferase [Thermoanaerobaculaceae bacterium]|nr:class I SAM-dependent methyltransferase [Thermoanaerobaculaceae bacterium]
MSDPFALSGAVRLKPGRDASLRRLHPWVYRGALAAPLPGGVAPVEVLTASGARLGVALPGASGGSLALRMVAFGDAPWSAAALADRLLAAAALRSRLGLDADAYRLVHAEGDDLPGLVIDRYAGIAVCELYEAAWEAYLPAIAATLGGGLGLSTVLVRRPGRRGAPVEAVTGELPAEPVVVREGVVRLPADLVAGQKTGLFLDQRENRRRLGALAPGATVLNLFSYSGGFALAALAGGAARAVNVDASQPALALARLGYRLNGFACAAEDFVAGDAFAVAREMAAGGAAFDAVVVDPPAFVKRKSELEGGLRGYKDVNLQALRLLRSGGLLVSCSCSALVDEESFARALAAAALDARRPLRVLERRGAGPDHPVSIFCPEARHLKAWFCRVA